MDKDADGLYTAEYWWAKHEEAMAISDRMKNPSAKATMRVVAESYALLARQYEQQVMVHRIEANTRHQRQS